MNLLNIFESEVNSDKKILCIIPVDEKFSSKNFSVKSYLRIKCLSNIWKEDSTEIPETFRINYIGEDRLIHNLELLELKELLDNIYKYEFDFKKVSLLFCKLNFGFKSSKYDDVKIYQYNYYKNNQIDTFKLDDLIKEIFYTRHPEFDVDKLFKKYNCINISIDEKCFFNSTDTEWKKLIINSNYYLIEFIK